MPEEYIMATFADEESAADTLTALRSSKHPLHRVYSPYPGHRILHAMKMKKSPVGYFTLIGGLLGFFAGFGLSIYTAGQWSLIVSGKPVTALVPFFIVGFECTILFSVLGNIIGLLTQARLPRTEKPPEYDAEFSGTRFGILTSCRPDDRDKVMALVREKGGVGKVVRSDETKVTKVTKVN